MKLFHTVAATLAVFLLISTTGVSSQGFLSTLRNAFSGRPVRQSQPARPAFRPQPQQQQFQQQPQQQQFQQQPQQQQFQAQPQQQTFQQQPQQFQQQQQPQQFAQQPQQFQIQGQRFNPQPQQVRQQRPQQNIRPFVSRPAQSQQASVAFRNQNSNSNSNSNSNNNNNAAPVNSCPALPREDLNDREGPSRCPDGLAPAFQYRGMNVILTWKEDSHPSWNEGCRNFTGIQADNYCRAQGGRAASLDTNEAAEQYMKQSAIYAQRYYWTGGRLNHRCGVLSWPSGKTEGWIKGQRFWSPTGGSASKGPQPDNRHELEDGHPGEPEKCLGVLNNFYADGIKWHDVACHHRKPTICEVPINRG